MAELKRLFVVLIFLSMVGLAWFSFRDDLASNYGVALDPNYTSTETTLNQGLGNTLTNITSIQKQTEQSGGISLIDTGAIVLTSAFAIIKAPITLISIFSTFLAQFSSTLGIGMPAWFFAGVIGLISVVIIFAILGAIFKKDL